MKDKVIRVSAAQYEDHDGCLAAAIDDYIEQNPALERPWRVSARWEDNQRETILLTVPDEDEA